MYYYALAIFAHWRNETDCHTWVPEDLFGSGTLEFVGALKSHKISSSDARINTLQKFPPKPSEV